VTGRWQRPAAFLTLGVLAPTALYYGLRAVGVTEFVALLAGAVLPVLGLLAGLVRRRRPDTMAWLWGALVLLALAVSLVGGDPRFLLARDALVTVVVGAWFAVSAATARPLALVLSRPVLDLVHRHPPGRWEGLWRDEPRFRTIWRRASLAFGAGCLADAAARVGMAYTLPVDLVPALSTALYLVTSVVLLVAVNVYYARSGLWSMLFTPRPEPAAAVPAEGPRP
jgi:hypothetical protein